MREVGRFNSRNNVVTALERVYFNWETLARSVADYVISRQNEDGGYTFCRDTDSTAQDTHYGLAILDLLGVPFPNVKQTIKWLREFVPDSLYSHYHVNKALKLCGQELNKRLKAFLNSTGLDKENLNTDVYVEVASEFETVFMTTELIKMAGVAVDHQKVAKWLLKYQNEDGGFGVKGNSNLNSTYHAVASLFNLGYPVKLLNKTCEYVRACEKPCGGFTVVPNSFSPYMEHTYYGVMTLSLMGENIIYPKETAMFVFNCRNANGGFARSEVGIATFEDTFYAVSILRTISR